MKLVSTTEKPEDLRRGLSEEWRTPPPDEEDSEKTGNEMEVSSQPREYIKGATARYPDFHRLMKAADLRGGEVPPHAVAAISSLEDSDRMDVVHELGTNPKEIRKMKNLSPEAVTARVHELLSRVKQRRELSSAASLPLEGISFKEFSRRRAVQEQARRRR